MGNGRGVNRLIFLRALRLAAVCVGGLVLFSVEARAVSLTLVVTNITMPSGQTYQMPLTGSDPDGLPLRFSAAVSNKKAVTAAIAPRSNRSLDFNVSGVDSNNQPFTGDMVLQLYEDLTPVTTARIIDLVNSNFYNGLLFQRVIAGFVAQGGGSTNDPNFESGVSLQDEFNRMLTYDGFGQLGMANGNPNNPDSNDSQFFITDVGLSIDNTNAPSPENLNFQQPIFGQLTRGFDVLSEIMSTPVGPNSSGENSAPLSNVVINTATIITNSQDGVLRLTASSTFTGLVTVTVSATNAANQVATQTLQVKVIANTNNSPAFMGLIPANLVLTQNTAATFIITTTDIDGDPIFIGAGYAGTFAAFTNIVASIIPRNRRDPPGTNRIWFSPDLALTGTVSVLVAVRDTIHNFDGHILNLTFVPRSASPTMMITSLKGTMQDGGKTNGDSVSVNGNFAFIGQSDHIFSSNDVLVLTLGNPAGPLTLTVTPDNTGVKFRDGSMTAHVLQGLSSNVNISAQFNSRAGAFRIGVKGFNFPVAISNQVEVGIALGNDYVTDVRTWIEKSPGMFAPPPVGFEEACAGTGQLRAAYESARY